MKLNIDFNAKSQMALITFALAEFKAPRDFFIAISIISTFAADFDLDPELEQSDLKDIISATKEKEKDAFIFEISEGGIEVSF